MQTTDARSTEVLEAHLESALELAEDPEQRRHLREALQLLETVESTGPGDGVRPSSTDAERGPSTR